MLNNRTTFIAMIGAALMLAHQVAGKAVRDSFFLSNHPASDLPKMMIAAAVVSILLVFISTRLMRHFGPFLIVPSGFFLSSFIHIAEYLFVEGSPSQWSIFIYLHIFGFSAILLSGFWSLMSEAFNPRTAKQVFGRIAGVGTLGGIGGGILAERAAALSSASSVLLLLAALHLFCSIALFLARPMAHRPLPLHLGEVSSPLELFRRAPYLGMIGLVVLAGTCSAAILDYLFKAGAGAAFGKGESLLRFFAVFYALTQIITFIVQTFLTQRSLHRFGIGPTISALPLGTGIGALAALVTPVFPVFTLIRSLEFILRGSLFRSAYELLYTPVPSEEKRAAKTLIDVACDRTGEAIGGAIIQLLLLLGVSFLTSGLLGIALALAAASLWISFRLNAVYSDLVQQRLVDRAVELDLADIEDLTTRSAIISVQAASSSLPEETSEPLIVPMQATDSTLEVIRDLRSEDKRRILSAMTKITRPPPIVAAQLIRLLAWNDIYGEVREMLLRDPCSITGLLVDHLTNQKEIPFGIRRRIPRILAHCNSQVAIDGLLAGLADDRFEVRFQCSRALDSIMKRESGLKMPAEMVFDAVERELQVAHPIWNSRQLLDPREGSNPNAFLDEILRERADKSLEHIFSLFSTVLPREPIKIAFRAFHTDDKTLRGLAAEYLDSMLPTHIRKQLWAMVEPEFVGNSQVLDSGQDALSRLIKSHESLVLLIEKTPPKY